MPKESLLPALIHIQANLDGDLSLETLAARQGLSPAYFQRVFSSEIGESPKQYTQRLRLERAAHRLWLHNTTVLETALTVGFQDHETFTRAFRRHFGIRPKDIKLDGILALPSIQSRVVDHHSNSPNEDYELSSTRIVTMKPMHLAFIRHVGPYEEVPDTLWRDLQQWAENKRLNGHRVLLGIGHDSPGITPPDKLRFDAAMRMDQPFHAENDVGCQTLEERRYAVTTHVGHYSTLPAVYPLLFQRIFDMPDFNPAGPPAIEFYHENTIDASLMFNHTDIYLPVLRASRPSA